MSYYKVKSISLKGDGLHLKMADSSISPTVYQNATVPFDISNEEERHKALTNLVKNICDGNYHMMTGHFTFTTQQDKLELSLITLETNLHNYKNVVDNRDSASYFYHIKGIDDKICSIIADNYFIPLVEHGRGNVVATTDLLQAYNKELLTEMDKTRETLKADGDWRIQHCGKLFVFKGYDIGLSDIDNKLYIFPERDYDRKDIGLLHNADKAITLSNDTLNGKGWTYLYNIENFVDKPRTSKNDYEEIIQLYELIKKNTEEQIKIAEPVRETEYEAIIKKCDEIIDKANDIIEKNYSKDEDELEIDER